MAQSNSFILNKTDFKNKKSYELSVNDVDVRFTGRYIGANNINIKQGKTTKDKDGNPISYVLVNVETIKNGKKITGEFKIDNFKTSKDDFYNSNLSVNGDKTKTPEEFAHFINQDKFVPKLNNLHNPLIYDVAFSDAKVSLGGIDVLVTITDKNDQNDSFSGVVRINKNEFKNIEKLTKVIGDAEDTKKKIDSITGENSKKTEVVNAKKELDKAIEDGKKVKDNPNSTQDEINDAEKNINDANAKAKKIVETVDNKNKTDKTILDKVITDAEDTKKKIDSITGEDAKKAEVIDAKNELDKSIQNAKKVKDNPVSTQKQINDMEVDLKQVNNKAKNIIDSVNNKNISPFVEGLEKLLSMLINANNWLDDKFAKWYPSADQYYLEFKKRLTETIKETENYLNKSNNSDANTLLLISDLSKIKSEADDYVQYWSNKHIKRHVELIEEIKSLDSFYKDKITSIKTNDKYYDKVAKAINEIEIFIEKNKNIVVGELNFPQIEEKDHEMGVLKYNIMKILWISTKKKSPWLPRFDIYDMINILKNYCQRF
ncbi:hypothetical protein KQ873_01615 [Mycoplasma zalophidermidis]|uniref:coiled-coil domain-containing protein n=1 Tax=Mycoplasma zalophidermidis TaxID=398174 RepID=UPI001C1245BE|nr:hypothetical protein [Mycoplasma zalophidermidis]MBU4689736.1 hypothetical protein [Mycoplasma zalophidermidis]